MSTATALSASNISAPEGIGSWAEAVEQESISRIESVQDGIKTVTDFIEEDGKRYKVITQFQEVVKKVPREVADRKKWAKFGVCENDPPGPHVSTTYVAEEVAIQFTRNRAGEQILDVQEEKKQTAASSREHCRHCKGNDHWSTNCPYKAMYMANEEELELEDPTKDLKGVPGGPARYVAPGMRDGPRGAEQRRDENTCRVSNLPQDCEEAELRELFGSIGRVSRVYISRDKYTNLPKGFAFVTYDLRMDAERAIEKLNGFKFNHVVMRVEWARQNN